MQAIFDEAETTIERISQFLANPDGSIKSHGGKHNANCKNRRKGVSGTAKFALRGWNAPGQRLEITVIQVLVLFNGHGAHLGLVF
jgi:hypothetical protein